ncbi:iron-siderophore ABC transporter substrate-binding protein [Thermoleophilia bacterium SCSIO 60948]|nr:iron-siderophore ABC transporter substrate-binding protein [Thermoleophilia bacterium SCSIO 60948]
MIRPLPGSGHIPSRSLRRPAAALAALCSAAVLAACGQTESTGETPEALNEGDPDAFPVEIEHKFGTTTIPELPERVVSVGYGEDDYALSLGVIPIAAREFIGKYAGPKRPWAQQELEGRQPEEISAEQINVEQIGRLDPDVILGVYSLMTEREYEQLSQIAPVVAQPDEYVDGGVPWQEQLRIDAEALGRTELAERKIEDVEGQFERVREEHPEWEDMDALLGVIDGGTLYGYAPQDPRQRFFENLGFQTPEEIEELAGDQFYAEFSKERIDLLDQDVLILLESTDTQEEIEQDPLFKQLDVAKEGRVVFVDADDLFAGAIGYGSPESLPVAIEEIVPELEQAADGDPTTEVDDVR